MAIKGKENIHWEYIPLWSYFFTRKHSDNIYVLRYKRNQIIKKGSYFCILLYSFLKHLYMYYFIWDHNSVSLTRQWLWAPFCRWSSERLNGLSKVIKVISDRARAWTQVFWLPVQCSGHNKIANAYCILNLCQELL